MSIWHELCVRGKLLLLMSGWCYIIRPTLFREQKGPVARTDLVFWGAGAGRTRRPAPRRVLHHSRYLSRLLVSLLSPLLRRGALLTVVNLPYL